MAEMTYIQMAELDDLADETEAPEITYGDWLMINVEGIEGRWTLVPNETPAPVSWRYDDLLLKVRP